jgi:AcrR family transcriptional regulator
MQVLKDEIKDRIIDAAVNEFYLNSYTKTTMQHIADRAGIAPSLIYSYFKNKQALFTAIVAPINAKLPGILRCAEETEGHPFDKFVSIEKQYFLEIFDNRKAFIVLMDKSSGTPHENAKEEMICIFEEHIKIGMKKNSDKEYDDLFAHILASNFVDGILEIVRHYKSRKWAEEMLDLIAQYYLKESS